MSKDSTEIYEREGRYYRQDPFTGEYEVAFCAACGKYWGPKNRLDDVFCNTQCLMAHNAGEGQLTLGGLFKVVQP